MVHESVLLHETIEGLALADGDIVVDGTVGNGGHSEAILASGKDLTLIALDLDEDALARSRARLAPFLGKVTFVHDTFRNLPVVLERLEIPQVSKILFDFGLSSNQLEESGRGFSFQKDEPLQMTFRKEISPAYFTARDVVNEWGEDSLREIIRGFGGERFASRIARQIVAVRSQKPIETSGELAEIIRSAVPGFYERGRIHPATRTFQAIRIAVNDELKAIETGLHEGFKHLAPGGRIAAISFHSLEDRIVKHSFRSLAEEGKGIIHTKKPISASSAEQARNPRSRSAKLRIIQKVS